MSPQHDTKLILPTSSETHKSLSHVDIVNLESCFCKDAEDQLKTEKSSSLIIEDPLRPIPDGDFEPVPLDDNLNREVKIKVDLSDLERNQLKACLRENANLFSWRAAEMLCLDLEVACHHLTIDPSCKVVAQQRRKQSPEKTVVVELAIKHLTEANFILEAKYTTSLSNVVLVKKSNGKWHMCTDYSDLNRACSKDVYHLHIIDTLVDNSAGF